MIPVVNRAESRAFDAHAIESCRVPSVVLMENAGRGAADVIAREIKHGSARVLVVCGAGNNGGDGWVVARHLLVRGHDVRVIGYTGRDGGLSPDAVIERDAYVGVSGLVVPASDLERELTAAQIVVDALFGTGLDRPIEGAFASVIEKINAAGHARVVALDLPSGLCADTGRTLGVCVRAAATVTFAFLKRGLMTPNGRVLAGDVSVVDIGVPPSLATSPRVHASEPSDVRARVQARDLSAHKYGAGHVAVLGGRMGTLGAALLASNAALRAGAGAATIITWPDAALAAGARVLEVMTAPLAGVTASEQSASAVTWLTSKRAAVVGPGFGTGDAAREIVLHAVTHTSCPLVIDADAISAYAGRASLLSIAEGRAVLTPHEGELARLLGVTSAEIGADRYAFVRRAARETKCVVLLKGACTLIASPAGDVVVNRTGSPALATAGAGDVLSGIIGALLCAHAPFEAAWIGAYLHGAAADAWSRAHGDRGLLAHEVAEYVPRVLANTRCVPADALEGALASKTP